MWVLHLMKFAKSFVAWLLYKYLLFLLPILTFIYYIFGHHYQKNKASLRLLT